MPVPHWSAIQALDDLSLALAIVESKLLSKLLTKKEERAKMGRVQSP
jgi:hypothetical protein